MRKLVVARRFVFRLSLPAAFALVSACDGPLLELAARDAGRDAGDDAAPTVASPSCPFIASDSDYPILRGPTCSGACSESAPLVRDLSSPTVLAASLTGAWTYCTGSLGPATTTGIQFFPGCVFFFLDDAGSAAGSYGTYDVVTLVDGGAGGIVLHPPEGDVDVSVSASACLGRARFAFDGGAVDLASTEPPDAAVAK